MKSTKASLLILLAIALLSGCGAQSRITGSDSTQGDGSLEDQTQVSEQLAANPDLIDEAVFSADVQAELEFGAGLDGPGGFGGPGGGLRDSLRRPPLRFWRRITSVDRRFEFSYRDTDSTGRPTLAFVTVNKTLRGTFNVAKPPVDSASRPVVVHKRLVDHWVRHLVLHRVDVPGYERPQWRVVGTSGVQITAEAAVTRIASVRVQGAALDTTILDPLAIFRLRRVLSFEAEDSVVVTVTTERNDDVVVLQLRDRHVPFHNNGDNTYSIKLRTGMLRGVHHLGIDALAHGTLFDDAAAYDSQAWILPFVVRPNLLADFGP
jgi:hypothetical protein